MQVLDVINSFTHLGFVVEATLFFSAAQLTIATSILCSLSLFNHHFRLSLTLLLLLSTLSFTLSLISLFLLFHFVNRRKLIFFFFNDIEYSSFFLFIRFVKFKFLNDYSRKILRADTTCSYKYIYIYIYITIKGEGDTALEAEAQLYSDYSIDLKIMQVKECKVIRPAR